MNKGLPGVLLVILGIVLIIWGVRGLNSIESDLSRFITGSPTNKSIWLIIGGGVAAMVGLMGLIPRHKGE